MYLTAPKCQGAAQIKYILRASTDEEIRLSTTIYYRQINFIDNRKRSIDILFETSCQQLNSFPLKKGNHLLVVIDYHVLCVHCLSFDFCLHCRRRECSSIIMDMEFQEQLPMEKSGFSTR